MWIWSASTGGHLQRRTADQGAGCKTNQSFEGLDLFQLGGVIFF